MSSETGAAEVEEGMDDAVEAPVSSPRESFVNEDEEPVLDDILSSFSCVPKQ